MTGGSQNDEPSAAPRQRPWSRGVDVPLPAEAGFSKHELWAWARILRGLDADMALYPGDAADPADDAWIAGRYDEAGVDPKDAAAWPAHRTLSERFLRTILFHEPWASAPERPIVEFRFARVAEPLDWQGRATRGQLWFFACRFEGAVSWLRLRVPGLLSLEGACIVQGFAADGAVIEGDLHCRAGFTAEGEVRLLGARIGGSADFSGATLKGGLCADGAVIEGGLFCGEGFTAEGEVRLLGARIGNNVEFDGAVLKSALNADGALIEGPLFCRHVFIAERDVNLLGARIGGAADFSGATLRGALNADGAVIEGGLYCRQGFTAEGEVRLLGARIGGDAGFSGATLKGGLLADGAVIEGDLHCRLGFTAEGEVRLVGARIGGDAAFDGATLKGALSGDNVAVEGMVFLREAERLGEVNLIAARIGRDLQLRQSRIEGRIDLTGARIEGELHLETNAEKPGPDWGPDACLILRNTRAGALAGSIAAFQRPSPEKKSDAGKIPGVGKNTGREPIPVELSGFHYERLGGLGASASATLAAAPVAELKRLLASRPKGADGAVDRGFDAQPYLALADALEAAGRRDAATRLRIAANDHERDAPNTPWRRRLGLAVSSALVGYGHRNARALFWLLALALGSGGLGLALAGEGLGADALGRWAWFGLDNALPLLELDKGHEGFLAARFGRAEGEPAPLGLASVFYAARILGFGIITFFVAGLTGFAAGSKR